MKYKATTFDSLALHVKVDNCPTRLKNPCVLRTELAPALKKTLVFWGYPQWSFSESSKGYYIAI